MAARHRTRIADESLATQHNAFRRCLENLSSYATHWTGTSMALGLSFGLVIGWLLVGPVFKYSDSWQLMINTTTTIITFLMVFLIQRAQNKEALSVQLKLNELIAAHAGASNRLISVEDLTEDELDLLRSHYRELVKLARLESNIHKTHSVDEAMTRHTAKTKSHR